MKKLEALMTAIYQQHQFIGDAETHNFGVDLMKLCFKYGITDFKDEQEIEATYGYMENLGKQQKTGNVESNMRC